mmetsp:Transcript_137111/g.292853  ORF Transcript_137111/g.292853 Transcript_137111/m.292853 type:complete len:355 (-) Transcript_137111:87-1151(-)
MAGPRTFLFHCTAALAVISSMLAVVVFQEPLRALVLPLQDVIEGTTVAYICLFVILCKAPEPSPVVITLAGILTWSPPVDLWRWFVTVLAPRLELPGAAGSGSSAAFGLALLLAVIIVYWVNGLLLLLMERSICPRTVESYRIQALKPSSRPDFRHLFARLAETSVVILPASVLCLGLAGCWQRLRMEEELPGPFEVFSHIALSAVCNEVIFFYGHWLMHKSPTLYSRVHKTHHEFKAPCGLSALYCHPIELLASDILPLAFGPVAFRFHAYTGIVWTMFAVMASQTHHCGIRWPWIQFEAQPNFHDFHHEKFNVNFGAMGWLDNLHGTSWDWQRDDTRFFRTHRIGAKAAKAA